MESPDSEARAPLACHICELRDLAAHTRSAPGVQYV